MQTKIMGIRLSPQFIYNGGGTPSSVVLDYREFTELVGMTGNEAVLLLSDRLQKRLDFNYPETEEQLDLW